MATFQRTVNVAVRTTESRVAHDKHGIEGVDFSDSGEARLRWLHLWKIIQSAHCPGKHLYWGIGIPQTRQERDGEVEITITTASSLQANKDLRHALSATRYENGRNIDASTAERIGNF